MRWLLMSILLINGCSFSYVGCMKDCLATGTVPICKELCKPSYP